MLKILTANVRNLDARATRYAVFFFFLISAVNISCGFRFQPLLPLNTVFYFQQHLSVCEVRTVLNVPN